VFWKVSRDDIDWTAYAEYPKSGNDGMVGFSSCQLYQTTGKRQDYGTSPTDMYYAFRYVAVLCLTSSALSYITSDGVVAAAITATARVATVTCRTTRRVSPARGSST
jgi:hypothetical protein